MSIQLICSSLRKMTLASLFAFIWFSCGERDVPQTGERGFVLEKVDSISVARETEIRILDYHSGKKQFLAVDKISEEFLLLDDAGNVLEQVYRRGEGPNEYNSDLLAVGFNQENGGYLAQNSVEQIHYNEAWEVKERIRFSSYSSIFFYGGPRMSVPYYQHPDGSDLFFFTNFFTGINNRVGGEVPTEIEANLIEQYNPDKGELEWVMRYDKELLPEFELGDKQKGQRPTQVYSLNREQGKLYLTFDRSTEIGVYDLAKDFELRDKIGFSHETFLAAQNAKNVGLFEFDNERFGVLYYQGLSEAASSASRESDPDYSPFLDPSLYKLILLNEGQTQGAEVPFPESCAPQQEMLPLPGSRLLLREKYTGEEEPVFHTYFIYQLESQ